MHEPRQAKCPACGNAADFSESQKESISRHIDIMTASMCTASVAHDLARELSTWEMNVSILRAELYDRPKTPAKKIERIANRTLRNTQDLRNLLGHMGRLWRYGRGREQMSLAEIATEVRSVLALVHPVLTCDYTPLEGSKHQVDGHLYLRAFNLAVEFSLRAIARELSPEYDIKFIVMQERLQTDISFSSGQPSTLDISMLFTALQWTIAEANGGLRMPPQGEHLTISWWVPFLREEKI